MGSSTATDLATLQGVEAELTYLAPGTPRPRT